MSAVLPISFLAITPETLMTIKCLVSKILKIWINPIAFFLQLVSNLRSRSVVYFILVFSWKGLLELYKQILELKVLILMKHLPVILIKFDLDFVI